MAANTLVTITYTVPGAKQREFEEIILNLQNRINAAQQTVRFSIYRAEDKANTFVEVYECDSTAAYDALEDSLDTEASAVIQRIATDFAEARQAVMTLAKL